MVTEKISSKRSSLLADVAEMYYIEGKDQSDIALKYGVTRSMVSRMLTDARRQGIVEIKVIRPINSDHDLEDAVKAKFGIESVFVVSTDDTNPEKLLVNLGRAAADVLHKYLRAHLKIGVAWGTSISAAIDAVQIMGESSIKVIQLVGAQGAQALEHDSSWIVLRPHHLRLRQSRGRAGRAHSEFRPDVRWKVSCFPVVESGR